MATVAYTKLNSDYIAGVEIYQWVLGNADDGVPVGLPQNADKTFMIFGTIGGATAIIEGSFDGTNYATLEDGFGTAISYTSGLPKCESIHQNTYYTRPKTSGGTTTAITVQLLVRRT